MIDAKGLLSAMSEYIDAAAIEKAARDRYDGYEWGYHGYNLIVERDRAAERVAEELAAFVDARIRAA
jgi:hypothetical protein